MNASALAEALASPHSPRLLHVLPAEHFAAAHIAGAVNACIYETAFLEKVRALAPDPALPIVVYGEGAPSLDSEEAATTLRAAGYTDVSDFRGGLREWRAAALPVLGHGALPVPPVPDGRYLADPATSVIRWTGRNLFNHHHGRIPLAEGAVEWRRGSLIAATFAIDLREIVCEDLADAGYNAMLIRHLHSPDFFDIERHPTARFEMTRAEAIPTATEGTPNFAIAGPFTLRGVTREITFPATIAAADADHLTAQAVLEIDRTQWGSHYGSGRFFAFLGPHVVNDHILLHLKIHATRA
ncbi:MAG TPA: YceI family protein [Chthoniobacterales bacterium]|jgi:polyisoprenoid-binding protein YceI